MINMITFQEWIKQKQLPPKQTDESEKEAEKRKANELRQLMAQVIILLIVKTECTTPIVGSTAGDCKQNSSHSQNSPHTEVISKRVVRV